MHQKEMPGKGKILGCPSEPVQDEFNWMSTRDQRLLNWEDEQNNRTTKWVSEHKSLFAQREGKQKASYKNPEEMHGKIYASSWGATGSADAVILDLNYNEQEYILHELTSSGKLRVYSVAPNSKNENLLAISCIYSDKSSLSLLIYDNKEKRILKSIDGVYFFKWSPCGERIYYSLQMTDEQSGKTTNKVFYLKISDFEQHCIYSYDENAVFILLEISSGGDLFIHVAIEYNRILLVYMDTNSFEYKYINKGKDGNFYYIGCINNKHYIYTTCDASAGKVVRLRENLLYSDAEPVIAEPSDCIMQGATIAEDKIIVFYLNGIFTSVDIFNDSGFKTGEIKLPDEYGAVELYPESPLLYSKGSKHLYMNFKSFITPSVIVRYNIDTETSDIVYYETDATNTDAIVEQVSVSARDGTALTAYIVGASGDTPRPALLYGYGGFGSVAFPNNVIEEIGMSVIDWINAGGAYVHCLVRGGGEYGQQWHDEGKKANKINSFHDFIDIAQYLIAHEKVDKNNIAAVGSSNGGLLVSGAMALKPDLFKAIVACIPLTDMIGFADDPRGSMYINEYGDPSNEEQLKYLLNYSPYHNLKEDICYPSAYFQAGIEDLNAPSYHASKFIARLQKLSCGEGPYLLRLLNSGHDFGVGDEYKISCYEKQLFLLKMLEMI